MKSNVCLLIYVKNVSSIIILIIYGFILELKFYF
jgi:hypothetical protein